MAHLGHLSTETKSHGKEYILLPLQQDENKQHFGRIHLMTSKIDSIILKKIL